MPSGACGVVAMSGEVAKLMRARPGERDGVGITVAFKLGQLVRDPGPTRPTLSRSARRIPVPTTGWWPVSS